MPNSVGRDSTATNMGIAASGAGSWQLRQQFAIRLLYRREVINLAFSFYLQPLVKTRQQFWAGRYKIPRLTAIPESLCATLGHNLPDRKKLFLK